MTMYVCMAMYAWLCMYCYVCRVVYVWLCMYDYVCMAMYLWPCIFLYQSKILEDKKCCGNCSEELRIVTGS